MLTEHIVIGMLPDLLDHRWIWSSMEKDGKNGFNTVKVHLLRSDHSAGGIQMMRMHDDARCKWKSCLRFHYPDHVSEHWNHNLMQGVKGAIIWSALILLNYVHIALCGSKSINILYHLIVGAELAQIIFTQQTNHSRPDWTEPNILVCSHVPKQT